MAILQPSQDGQTDAATARRFFFFFFFTLVTGPRRSSSLELSDTRVYEPQIRACLITTAHFCEVVALELRAARSMGMLLVKGVRQVWV